jgi:rhodanese-related sulfurtransferase
MLSEITVTELKEKLDQNAELHLLDVREPVEFQICRLPDSELISLGNIPRRAESIPKDKPVVVICHHGFRSAQAIQYLNQRFGFTNLLNLKGGIHAWAQQIDPTMPVY